MQFHRELGRPASFVVSDGPAQRTVERGVPLLGPEVAELGVSAHGHPLVVVGRVEVYVGEDYPWHARRVSKNPASRIDHEAPTRIPDGRNVEDTVVDCAGPSHRVVDRLTFAPGAPLVSQSLDNDSRPHETIKQINASPCPRSGVPGVPPVSDPAAGSERE